MVKCYKEDGLTLIFQVEFYVSHCNTLFSWEFDIVKMADILHVLLFLPFNLTEFTFHNFLRLSNSL